MIGVIQQFLYYEIQVCMRQTSLHEFFFLKLRAGTGWHILMCCHDAIWLAGCWHAIACHTHLKQQHVWQR